MRPKHVACAEKTKFVVNDGSTYVNYNMIHNNETNLPKTMYRAKPPNMWRVRSNWDVGVSLRRKYCSL